MLWDTLARSKQDAFGSLIATTATILLFDNRAPPFFPSEEPSNLQANSSLSNLTIKRQTTIQHLLKVFTYNLNTLTCHVYTYKL